MTQPKGSSGPARAVEAAARDWTVAQDGSGNSGNSGNSGSSGSSGSSSDNGGSVPFASLALGEDAAAVRAAIDRVIASGWYILGPEVEAFEAEFAAACGAEHAVSVANGTDAIALILKALGIGPGDEVITTPISAAFTALAILMAGARPVFVDVDDTLTLDPAAVAAALTPRTRAILPVHLYGQPAAMDALEQIAARHQLAVIEDCCQAHLATSGGRPVGTIGVAGAFSFYPTKNLGALGDGGAIVTRDGALAERLRRLRNGGQSGRYCHVEAGVNSRLDELQAAVLRARLPYLPAWTARRRALAALYRASLTGCSSVTPVPERDRGHVYHLFVIRTDDRPALERHLRARGIETLVHYPTPIPRQPMFSSDPAATEPVAPCPRADVACGQVLSLPLHPALAAADVERVSAAIADFRPQP
jgi:dTDP-4-amino-4,6-dideoxygalactose transaminase